MVTALALIGALAVLAAAAVAWALWRTTRPDWARSDVRVATFEFLVTIAPFFGGRIQKPRPDPPAVTTPGDEPAGPVAGRARELAEGEPDPGRRRRPMG